uniref:Leucine rich repeat containing 18a n=1 Tax=Salarias fasciatus TaxID=181472 RepID=A0A672FHT9_SALFA
MPKGKGGKGAKGTKVTLKIAKKAVRMTPDGCCRLTLSNMGIAIFPKCLLKLTNLTELDLSRNRIQKLPDSIGDLESLRWLDLHSNKLESLPESLGKLVLLTHLNLSNNRLTSAGFPATLSSLTSLTSLNLGMNQLDTLPPSLEALDSLQELGLFDNLFIKLPEFVKVYPNLKKINVKGNPSSQEDGGVGLRGKKEREKDTYLVHESSLCRTCLKKCQVDSVLVFLKYSLQRDSYLALAITSVTPFPFNAGTTVVSLRKEKAQQSF